MKLLDVNVVLAAHREDHPDHATARPWLDGLLASGEQFGVPWMVWWSFLRLSSHPRVFSLPTPLADSLGFISAVRTQPGHVPIEPGESHLDCLRAVCGEGEATADLVPDAVLAALATEHGAQVVSFDRDFARFPRLAWSRPEP
ncbi:MAG: type II toxin-antitoxin system VapC family toxin [Chloroflexi bacterium]|nr:MAG: type II toxin-antitoxin system VapC family toxin [Chloroflexota bacterium]